MNKQAIEPGTNDTGISGFDIAMYKESLMRLKHMESILGASHEIVHDINNQLGAIVALADLLSRTEGQRDDVANKVAKILDSAKTIVSLTEKWSFLAKGYSVSASAVSASAVQSQPQPQSLKSHTRRGINKKMHILLVDDEEVVCTATEEMLKRLNYDVTSAGSGIEAVQLYTENWQNIDLVVLDMMMPEMDGVEVFSRIRKVNPDANVLVSSGYSDNDKARVLTDAGACGYLQKPFRLSQLSEKVRSILEE